MAATNDQVQFYNDQRIRPWSKAFVAAYLQAKDDKAQIDDIYANVSAQSPTWVDANSSNSPHAATPSDVLAWNAFITDFITFVEGNANYSIVQKLNPSPINP